MLAQLAPLLTAVLRQEAGQKSPLVLEAAPVRSPGFGAAYRLCQEGDKALLVLRNEGQISH